MHTSVISRADIKAHFTDNKPFMPLNINPAKETDLSPAVQLLSKIYQQFSRLIEKLPEGSN